MSLVVLGHTCLYVGMYNSSLLNWFSPNTKNSGNMGNCLLLGGGGELDLRCYQSPHISDVQDKNRLKYRSVEDLS